MHWLRDTFPSVSCVDKVMMPHIILPARKSIGQLGIVNSRGQERAGERCSVKDSGRALDLPSRTIRINGKAQARTSSVHMTSHYDTGPVHTRIEGLLG